MGRVNIVLAEEVHRQAKSASALRGTTLISYINLAIESRIKRIR